MSGIMVDAMPGDTDDEKLAAAIERATAMRQAPTAPPTLVDLLLGPRAYTFRRSLPPIPAGVRIVGGLGEVLQLLALPYADHEDYRPEWRP